MTVTTAFLSRREHFDRVGSTNDVVRDWLAAGTPEVCLAVADEQTAGRGRQGRTWVAPSGAALLLSAGFRPTWLPPDQAWRLAATVAMAMAEAAEQTTPLTDGSIGLKWPNDLVDDQDGPFRKLGGVLGESDGLGTADPRVVVGIGLNVDWAEASFPAELRASMTSLRAMCDGPVDRDVLLHAFVDRLAALIEALHAGIFDVRQWIDRQVTTGRQIALVEHDGSTRTVTAIGVDPVGGGLRLAAATADDPDAERTVVVGEIRHVRLVPAAV